MSETKEKEKIKVMRNGDIKGRKCFAYFGGKDGMGTCNKKCQWWNNSYLQGKGCPWWRK